MLSRVKILGYTNVTASGKFRAFRRIQGRATRGATTAGGVHGTYFVWICI